MALEDLTWTRRVARTGAARALREAAGLSLADVAQELGVEPSTLSRWERGLRRPSRLLAVRWADILRRIGA